MDTQIKPLGKVKTIIDAIDLDVSYAYDDLVFIQHNAFLLRFDLKDARKLYLHFNEDCETEEAKKLEKALMQLSTAEGLVLSTSKKYRMGEIAGRDELEINFLD